MLDAALRAIAEPHRRAILRLVQDTELSSGEVAAHFALTGPAISQHLGVLEEAGLVTVRRLGARRLYRARPEGLAELKAFIDAFESENLRRIAKIAEADVTGLDKQPTDRRTYDLLQGNRSHLRRPSDGRL